MSDTRPSLDDLLEFPTRFVFRAMGESRDAFERDCDRAVRDALARPPESVTSSPSRKGNYTAVRVAAVVVDKDEILAVYAALRAVQGIRLVL
jgi:putative lipoic acid-binding regulatory protein